MKIERQIWQCVEGQAERVWGLGAPAVQHLLRPLLYCVEHGRLCRHKHVRQEVAEYVEYTLGENVVDTRN